jgi:hypothetical protein
MLSAAFELPPALATLQEVGARLPSAGFIHTLLLCLTARPPARPACTSVLARRPPGPSCTCPLRPLRPPSFPFRTADDAARLRRARSQA